MNFVTCEIKAQQPQDLPGWSTFTHFQQSSTAFFVARSSFPQGKFHHPHLRLKLTPELNKMGTRPPKRCLVPHLVSLRVRSRRNHRECDLGAGELRTRECKSCEYRTVPTYLRGTYLVVILRGQSQVIVVNTSPSKSNLIIQRSYKESKSDNVLSPRRNQAGTVR